MIICEKCGESMNDDGVHPKGYYPLDEETLDMFAKLECSGCGSKVWLKTVKEQGLENWRIMRITGKTFCPGCSHQLNLC